MAGPANENQKEKKEKKKQNGKFEKKEGKSILR